MLKIPTNLLNAISQFAADKDVRYYPNGVTLELRAGCLRLMATTDALVGVCLLPDEYPEKQDGEWIMPNAMVEAIIKSKAKDVQVSIIEGETTVTLGVMLNGAQLSYPAIEGRPVDWRRVIQIPNMLAAPSNFDAALLGRIAKASKLSGSSRMGYFGLQQYGDKTGLFSIDGVNIVGAIAPLNPKNTPQFSSTLLNDTVSHVLDAEQFV